MAIFIDNREEHQKETLRVGVAADDKIPTKSGRGTVAVWACAVEHVAKVLDWADRRTDFENARVVSLRGFRPKQNVYSVSVYPVTDGHQALK